MIIIPYMSPYKKKLHLDSWHSWELCVLWLSSQGQHSLLVFHEHELPLLVFSEWVKPNWSRRIWDYWQMVKRTLLAFLNTTNCLRKMQLKQATCYKLKCEQDCKSNHFNTSSELITYKTSKCNKILCTLYIDQSGSWKQ